MVLGQLKWYILTTTDLKQSEARLLEMNATRHDSGLSTIQYFIPFLATENECFSVLRSFVFIYCSKEVLSLILQSAKRHTGVKYLFLYRDRNRHAITVPDSMMQKFLMSCSSYRDDYIFTTDIENNLYNRQVILKHTVFKGEKAYVLKVKHTRTGLQLTLGLQLIRGTVYLKMTAKEGDIAYVRENDRICDADHLLQQLKNDLLLVLSRRVNRKESDESLLLDISTLNTVSSYRYHCFEDKGLRCQFLSLMLICAHLQKDEAWQAELLEASSAELAQLLTMPMTESACWLYTGLYVCTGNPEFRNKAKIFVQNDNASDILQAYVRLIRKRRIK